MKKSVKLLSLLLCGAILAAPLVSCSKSDDGETSSKNGENVGEIAKTEVLTNVFKGTKVTLPEDYEIQRDVTPYYDSETGNINLFCSYWHGTGEIDEEYGYETYGYDYIILTLGNDYTVLEETKLDIDNSIYINEGVLLKDKLYFIQNEYNFDTSENFYYTVMYDLTDGSITSSEEISSMFTSSESDRSWFYINGMAVDGDGYVYLSSDMETVVLNDSFQKSFSVMASGWINNLATASDGAVYASGYFGESGEGCAPIDKGAKAFGKALELPSNINSYDCYFADGYDIYYSTDEGLFGYNFPAEESAETTEPTLVLNYQNSDLTSNNDILKIVNPDVVILIERDPVTYASYPMIYNRSADIDLSQIKVLEIAYVDANWHLPSQIVAFNKANDNVRIIARDYSSYNSDEDYNAGSKQLVNDMLNGIYKPDIVTGYSTNDEVIRQIYSNNLYTDLYRFLDASTKVTRDDLFGCVHRTFATSDGKLWAIGSYITAQTLIGTREMLGDREGWTLTEMIEFAKSLPEGTVLMDYLSKDSAANRLLGNNGYGAFIDFETNTCNFESEDFISYLEFLNTLPDTYNYENINYDDDRYLNYHNGKIALASQYYYDITEWISEEIIFNTKDIVHIGYPSTESAQNGTIISMPPYVITSFCEYPEEAWSFLEMIIAPEKDSSAATYSSGIPVLKSQFDTMCEEYYTFLFTLYYNGSASWRPYDSEYDAIEIEEETDQPGIRKFFTEEDAATMRDWFDNVIGTPVSQYVDEEITNIVNEEISSYTNGAKTAADCARIIQSRVTIWLAEHE